MAKIELSDEEANVLVNLLNVAVKAVGLEGAEAALHFQRKIKTAMESGQREIEDGSIDPAETPLYKELTRKKPPK